MRIKTLLVFTPILLVGLLVQAYFWVPTYEDQIAGDAQRLRKFVEASIGDAKLLNPALHADSASGKIVDKVFDTLLDLDENLQLRGRLATHWQLTETAYLQILPGASLARGVLSDAPTLVAALRGAMDDGTIDVPPDLLTDIQILPARTLNLVVSDAADSEVQEQLLVNAPPRLQFTLRRVDQTFFSRLRPVLGDNYQQQADSSDWHRPVPDAFLQSLRAQLPVFEHNPEIEFELRRGVRFHDGHLFDAGDVKFTYEAIMNPRNLSPRTSDFEPIKSITTLGSHKLRVVYKRLFSPAVMAWAAMGILPEHLLNDAALVQEMDARDLAETARAAFGLRDSQFNRKPVGTGPFRFAAWQSDEMVHLRRFDDYWDGPPIYHEYFFRIIPDTLTREVEFRTGAADSYNPEPYQVARYRDDDRYRVYSSPSSGYTYIGYNNRRPLFSNPRVRRALGMALNIDEIIKYVLYGEGERTTGPYPKTSNFYATQTAAVPYDPEGALRLLRELGWVRNADGWLEKDGQIFEFNLITNNGNQKRRNILSIAQDAWKRIGVKCNTQVFEWAVFLQDFVNPGDFDAVVLGWQLGIDADLFQLWHSSQTGANQLNFVGYVNPRADRLMEDIRREYDPQRQTALAQQLHQLVAEDQPYTFLYAPRKNEVLDPKIVMVADDGRLEPLRADRRGELYYFFSRWRKLAHTPQF
ncbi:MAG: ABC transporter substrate-binding protein [Gammaproteobacteria bacterium]|nr:ABC transporter substrate-binding protein [Gammaproteobacteria bacterium]